MGKFDDKTWHIKNIRDGAGAPCAGQADASFILHTDSPFECCCCSSQQPLSEAVTCDKGHQYCQLCFKGNVKNQIVGEFRPFFLASKCKVKCDFCGTKDAAFDMRICASRLDDDLYSKYLECLSESAVVEMQTTYETRMEQMKKNSVQSSAMEPAMQQIGKYHHSNTAMMTIVHTHNV